MFFSQKFFLHPSYSHFLTHLHTDSPKPPSDMFWWKPWTPSLLLDSVSVRLDNKFESRKSREVKVVDSNLGGRCLECPIRGWKQKDEVHRWPRKTNEKSLTRKKILSVQTVNMKFTSSDSRNSCNSSKITQIKEVSHYFFKCAGSAPPTIRVRLAATTE